MHAGWRWALALLWAGSASAQVVEVTRVTSGNALSTVAQRHLVRVQPPNAGASLLMAVQRDHTASPDGEGLHWYRSDDEGRSWRHYARIFEDGSPGFELHMTADVIAVGDDLAVVWSYDTTVTNFPSDALDPQRRVYFQWWRYDGGGDWKPESPRVLGTPSSGRAFHRANLTRDSRGRLWVQAWYRAACPTSAGVSCADGIRVWVSEDGGASFQAQPQVSETPVLGGGRILSLGTRLMILWGDYSWDNPARYAIREDSAPLDQWEGPFVAFSDRDSIYHGAAFNTVADGRGGLHLVFKDRREQLYYRFFDGTAFGPRTFVDGEAHWGVQPAITLHGDELYVCTNHYRASTGTYELQSRRLSQGFANRVVLEATADRKLYPTAPERVSASVSVVPCAFTSESSAARLKVALQEATPTEEEPPPPPDDEPPSDAVVQAFQDGVAPNGYAGTRDSCLLSDQASVAQGAATTCGADGSPDAAILLAWDVSSIPPGSAVRAVEIVLDVTNSSQGTYELYPLLRQWDEASATWTVASTGQGWSSAGAQGAADRSSTVIGSLGPVNTGVRRVPLNAAGIALVQEWVANPSTNYGVILQDYAGSGDGLDVGMREFSPGARRPRLEVTYVPGESVPALPVVSVSAGGSVPESGSVPGRFTVRRSGNLSGALVVDYSVTGSASVGSDYLALSGSVAFGEGESTAEVLLTPVDDSEEEAAETVVLTIAENEAFTLGSQRSATLQIDDDDRTTPPPSAVTLSFQQGVAPTATYAGARDAAISSGAPTTNFGSAASVAVDGSPDESILMAWDLSAVPAGSIVESATLTLQVQNPTAHAYGAFALSTPWSEGQATWTRATATSVWQSPGARGAGDRSDPVLVTLTAPGTGSATYTFTAAGVAALQRWVDEPSSNHGLILQELPGASDGLDFVSREGLTAQRPRLTVTYRPR